VVEQGNLRFLMFEANDFSKFHAEVKIHDFSNIQFNTAFSKFFTNKRYMWSAVALGQYRFSLENCTDLVLGRSKYQPGGPHKYLVTFEVESNLRVQILIDNTLQLNKTSTWEQPVATFETTLQEM
jgi:hypothetical protein